MNFMNENWGSKTLCVISKFSWIKQDSLFIRKNNIDAVGWTDEFQEVKSVNFGENFEGSTFRRRGQIVDWIVWLSYPKDDVEKE